MQAYNSGNFDSLRDFVLSHFDQGFLSQRPNRASSTAAYWLNVFSQYGPIRYHSISRIDGFETEAWTIGAKSRVWLGLDFTVDSLPPSRIVDYGVVRGSRPNVSPKLIPKAGLSAYLNSYLNELTSSGFFSGAVLVGENGKEVFSGAFGDADRENHALNRLETKFYIASLSKMFTATAILQLADKNVLALTDTVRKYLPGFPKHIASQITIRRLLTHTSGIELDDIEGFDAAVLRAKTLKELYQAQLDFLSQLPNYEKFTPPERFNYSNEDYDLLGVILERVTGQSYDDYLRGNIFEPAGMTSTKSYAPNHPIGGGALGYTRRDTSGQYLSGSPHVNSLFMQARTRPSGGHYSTVRDLFRFMTSLKQGKLLARERSAELWSPQVTLRDTPDESDYYGFGFQIEKKRTIRMVGHGGGFYGASARLDDYPDLGFTVIVLSNQEWVANNVADHIREIIGGFGK
jgi:CubicO group peptidase (beta-lactamase class C family)